MAALDYIWLGIAAVFGGPELFQVFGIPGMIDVKFQIHFGVC